MYSDNPVFNGRKLIVPVLVCAALCLALDRAGFFSLFFLVPLGFCAVALGPAAAWICFAISALGNGLLSAWFSVRYGQAAGAWMVNAGFEALFFTVQALGFTWIMTGNPPFLLRFLPRVRTAFRFIAASIAGSIVFLVRISSISKDGNFLALVGAQIEAVYSGIIASYGGDAASQEALSRLLVPEKIIETILSISFRGAALVTVFFLFFISRQGAFILARLIMKKQRNRDLIFFHAPKKIIWVFSLCLPVIVASSVFSLKYIDIAVWNLLVICAIMFLAQGGGIVLHYLARRPMSVFTRLLVSLLFVFLVISPGINLAVIAALVLLGIAENWLPLRNERE
jgi:hypothetical protein